MAVQGRVVEESEGLRGGPGRSGGGEEVDPSG
jgi:hypothetical protein